VVILAPAAVLVGCRQLLAIDEERPLLSEAQEGGAVEAAVETEAAADAGSPFSVFNAVPSGEALVGIWGAGPEWFVAVGTSSVAYVYDEGTLSRLGGTQKGRDYLAVWGFSKTDVFAVGQSASGGGFIDHFDGKGWTAVFDAPSPLLSVWGTSQGAGAVLAVGARGKVFGWSPGQTWKTFDTLPKAPGDPDTPGAPRLWSISGKDLADFSIAADSRLYHYEPDAGGFAFYEPTAQTNTLFRSVWQAGGAGTNVYFGTNFFGLLYFSGRGSEASGYPGTVLFRDEATPGAAESFIQCVWGTSERVIAVGDLGRIYVYDTGLSTPARFPSPTDEPLGGVWGSSIDDVWIVGRRELILHGSIR
jgi:hypothetical protein